MKTFTYNHIKFNVSLTNSRGRYLITAFYRGKLINATTTDAEIYDYCDDEYPGDKNWAKRACFTLIKCAYGE